MQTEPVFVDLFSLPPPVLGECGGPATRDLLVFERVAPIIKELSASPDCGIGYGRSEQR